MSATQDQAQFVFDERHERIRRLTRRGCPRSMSTTRYWRVLWCRVLDTTIGVVSGRDELDRFIGEITRRRPSEDELPALYRTGTYLFDDETLIWEYPRITSDDVDQLDLIEVVELHGPLIRRHRIY